MPGLSGEWMQRCFSKNSGFIWLLFIFNYFTLGWSLLAADDVWLFFAYAGALFLAILLLTVGLQFLLRSHPIAFRRVRLGLLFFSLPPFLVELFVMHSYGALIGAGIVNSILDTNLKEAGEFIEMYVSWREIVGLLSILLAAVAFWRLRLWQRFCMSFCKRRCDANHDAIFAHPKYPNSECKCHEQPRNNRLSGDDRLVGRGTRLGASPESKRRVF